MQMVHGRKFLPFNRTFVELKHDMALKTVVRRLPFNRTFVELKHDFKYLGKTSEPNF